MAPSTAESVHIPEAGLQPQLQEPRQEVVPRKTCVPAAFAGGESARLPPSRTSKRPSAGFSPAASLVTTRSRPSISAQMRRP